MSLTKAEIEANFDSFTASWKIELPKSISALDIHRSAYIKSYSRIASMNAWRGNVLEQNITVGSLGFFAEALNDALVSHAFARFGSWRSALMSLRSCIENTCYCLYYKDHPVELRLWEAGQHRPGFSEILTYLKQHPDISLFSNSPVCGLTTIKAEYSTLSRAVHASAKNFRMSPNVHDVVIWNPDPINLAKWQAREQQTLMALNLLLATMFRSKLCGTQQRGLRKSLAIVLNPSIHARVKSELKITIPT